MYRRFALIFAGSLCLHGQTQRSASSGIDLTAIGRSANPCNDFYQYSCRVW
jgi:hypothetical protein